MKYAFLSSLLVPIGIMVILLLMPLLLLVTNQANAQAQNQTQSPSQILQGYFNKEHVTIFYESPKTVILQGDLIAYDTLATVTDPSGKPATAGVITDTNIQRTDLWEAMDLLRLHGFEIQQVMTSGVGSEGNPTVVYILMTK
jgi:hypothetical protein